MPQLVIIQTLEIYVCLGAGRSGAYQISFPPSVWVIWSSVDSNDSPASSFSMEIDQYCQVIDAKWDDAVGASLPSNPPPPNSPASLMMNRRADFDRSWIASLN